MHCLPTPNSSSKDSSHIGAKSARETRPCACTPALLVIICFYLSLGVSWQRLISGTDVTPQRLYCPSPMERDTSSTPKTRPSLKWGEQCQTLTWQAKGPPKQKLGDHGSWTWYFFLFFKTGSCSPRETHIAVHFWQLPPSILIAGGLNSESQYNLSGTPLPQFPMLSYLDRIGWVLSPFLKWLSMQPVLRWPGKRVVCTLMN